jgi:hypothetical protein
MVVNTNSVESLNLQNLQPEIQPILNKIFDRSPELKEVLEKYGVLESAEIQLNLYLEEAAAAAGTFQAACTRWCTTCGALRACGDCPSNPSQC